MLDEMSTFLQQGRAPKVKELVAQALNEGISPQEILEQGLLSGMNIIGEKFKNNEVFVPEVLISARAMNMGIEVLKPKLIAEGFEPKGTVVIGTVKGDLHDIGKNLVKMMMESKNINVVDLGVDVAPEKFIEAAEENDAKAICCSALLTTTMGQMKEVVDLAKAKGMDCKIMIGGAPVTQSFCDTIGADCYTDNASAAAEAALSIVEA
ncbi:MAG: cobalamin-binding protein [Clostridiales bacterium]|nr:MAG: cobalamin-binding protein [Clostridiales bacterium]